MKSVATILTICLAIVLGLTKFVGPIHPLIGWVHAFCEAALVGAIADWFAVVALFRHPLGIRLPHTAVIPSNQRRLARTLGDFIVTNFLTEDAIRSRLLRSPPSKLLANWITQPGVADRAAQMICENSQSVISALGTPEIKSALATHGRAALAKVPWEKVIASGLRVALAPESIEPLAERLVERIRFFVRESQDWLRKSVKDELPWYVPSFAHDHVFDRLMTRVEKFLETVQTTPGHPFRVKLREALSHWAQATLQNEIRNETLHRFISSILNSAELNAYLTEFLVLLQANLENAIATRPKEITAHLAQALTAAAKTVENSPNLASVIDNLLRTIAIRFCAHNANAFKDFISETVAGWNDDELVNKIESHISDDLQYIRINGAIVGGVVGVVLYAIGS